MLADLPNSRKISRSIVKIQIEFSAVRGQARVDIILGSVSYEHG